MAVAIGTAASGQPAQPSAAPEAPAQACNARQFETVVRFTSADGKGRQSKVKLCGTPGQSDADWARTLRDGAQKARAKSAWPPAARQQVATAIEAELAKVEAAATVGGASSPPALVAAPALPKPRAVLPPRSAAPEYSTLPTFPPPPVAAPIAAATPGVTAGGSLRPGPTLAALSRPKLAITCFSPGDIGGSGPCFAFNRDTVITVRAGEPLQHTALRFARGRAAEADHQLPAMAKGRSTSFTLPRSVCAGAVGGSLTIRIVRAPAGQPAATQVVGTEGPYDLRC
jgi:hypothetical protein